MANRGIPKVEQINAWAVKDEIFTSKEAAEVHCKELRLRALMQNMTNVDIIEALAKGELLDDITEIVEGQHE